MGKPELLLSAEGLIPCVVLILWAFILPIIGLATVVRWLL
jgi:hypothetical protein